MTENDTAKIRRRRGRGLTKELFAGKEGQLFSIVIAPHQRRVQHRQILGGKTTETNYQGRWLWKFFIASRGSESGLRGSFWRILNGAAR